MSVYLRFEPVPGAERTPFDFVPASIFLAREEEAFVIGFLKKASTKALDMEVDTHVESNGSERPSTAVTTTTSSSSTAMRKPGFSDNLYDDKLTIVPLNSKEAKEMQDPLGGIWLAPGYKVMLLPAEGCRMYYQRAVPDNDSWRRIKKGWAFDLAEPLMHALDGAVHIKIDTRIPRRRDVFFNALHDAFHPHTHTAPHSAATTITSSTNNSDPLSTPTPSSVSMNILNTKSSVAIPGVNASINAPSTSQVSNPNTSRNTGGDAHVSTRPTSHTSHTRALATRIHTAITGGRAHTAPRPAYHVLARVTVDWRPRGWVRPPSVRERTTLPLPARLVEPMTVTPPEQLGEGEDRHDGENVHEEEGVKEDAEGGEIEEKENQAENQEEPAGEKTEEKDDVMDLDHALENAETQEEKEQEGYERCQYARVASWLTRHDDGGESDTETDTDTETETTSISTEASDIETEPDTEENRPAASIAEEREEFEETQLYNHVYLNEDAREGLRKYAAALAARHARGIWPRAVRKVPVPSLPSEDETETEAEIRDDVTCSENGDHESTNTCTTNNTGDGETSEERDEFVDAVEAPATDLEGFVNGREEDESGLQTPKAGVLVDVRMRDVDPDATPRPRAGTQGRIGYD